MKQISLITMAVFVVAGCCSTDLRQASTSDLQVRRYELKHHLNMEVNWDGRPWQDEPYGDIRGELAEKGAIEQEISRRGVTAYYRPSTLVYSDNIFTSEK